MTADTFFKELNKLLTRYPKALPNIANSENSDYGEHLAYCKNMYIAFDCANSTDSMYVYDSFIAKNCVDCDYAVESELCYEGVDPIKSYNSDYLEYSVNMRDSAYAANCVNCHDVFGCVNLQNKSFCIFNRQLSEEEYRQKVTEYKKWPPEKVLAMVEELKKRYPVTQTHETHNQNSAYGNYSDFNKNCYMCFDGSHSENSGYLYDSHHNISCYDAASSYHNELSYENTDGTKVYNSAYTVLSNNVQDSSYTFNCSNVKNCIGCVSLSNKQYCILNRQFTKEEYETVSKQILEVLKEKNAGWENIKF